MLARSKLFRFRRNFLYLSKMSVHMNITDELVTNDVGVMLNTVFQSDQSSHKVMLFQPYIKWGKTKKRNTSPNLQLEEAVSLVNSLDGWEVLEGEMVPLLSFNRGQFFGSGKLTELKAKVRSKTDITAVFINVEMLKAVQHSFLEAEFQLPVYDRYLMVMNIFRQHAVSPEAKLQVSMAEIPYLWSKVHLVTSCPGLRSGGKTSAIGGLGVAPKAFHETRKLHLQRYEQKLKDSLEKLRLRRESARVRRRENDFPIVAVVGYTNSGKTSLIKALTGSIKLKPRNQLFATLDVTYHEGVLPCNLKVLYVDTLGFISDIPTNLIEPFRVTLHDAMCADIIVHVEDVSHPDIIAQRDRVINTLKELDIGDQLLNNVITVSNKIDLLVERDIEVDIPDTSFMVSCRKLTGLDALKRKIEDIIIKSTGRKKLIIRVKSGGSEMEWLYNQTAVVNVIADIKNPNYSLMSVFITDACLEIFKCTFIYPKTTA